MTASAAAGRGSELREVPATEQAIRADQGRRR
jgi:hypothetical protein